MLLYRMAIYNSKSLRSINLYQCRFQYKFSSQTPLFNYSEIDLGCSQSAIQQPLNIASPDILTKLSYFSPGTIYDTLDVFSRDLFLYLSDDLNLGMGAGIILISLGIKMMFAPVLFMSQLNAIKMKLLEPESKNFQASYQKLSQARDIQGSKKLAQNYRELRQKHNISMILPIFSLIQIPILMTWFFSLRYLTSLPDQYPGLKTDGFFWFKDLTQYDPYGILPIISATLSFWNISINPGMATGTSHPLGRFFKYFRFLPFVSIPIVVFFPAGVNLYWCSSALVQLLITAATRSEVLKKFFGIPQYLPGTILESLNQVKTQNIIHAVITQSKGQIVSLDDGQSQQKLEVNVGNNIQETISNNMQQKGSVKLYKNKPKKAPK